MKYKQRRRQVEQICSLLSHAVHTTAIYRTTSLHVHPTCGKRPLKAIDQSHRRIVRIFTLTGNSASRHDNTMITRDMSPSLHSLCYHDNILVHWQ